ncbi:Aspartate 1-decarboxylase precursor [Riemerella anatipestifer]|uniref:Aspartate 1-decarboxylase n=1 Tax=Riemerella anatipestifer TaxID=34085 RepID=A0A1S7DQ62_RIEAN|nr:Aspartate 1-decarboxylase precursor [Riemerella anatipestifer]
MTESDLNYMGSITIDEELIEAAGIVVGERVYIVNVNNGERFDTYVIKGKRKSGEVCLNGPAARKVQKGDIIIIISYAQMTPEEAQNFQPKIIFPNEETNLLT